MMFDNQSRTLDRFGALLIVSLASLVVLMIVDLGTQPLSTVVRWESVAASCLVATTLMLALRASGLSEKWSRVAALIVGFVIAVQIAVTIFANSWVVPLLMVQVMAIIVAVLACAAPLAVIRRVAQHRNVVRSTLLGAISGYLLIAIAFFYLLVATGYVSERPVISGEQATSSYMYFSLVTITTTGYGDVTAVGTLGRLLATSEALLGQIYLVTFVAMLVGLYVGTKRKKPLQSP